MNASCSVIFFVKILVNARKYDFITMYIKNEVKYIIINIKDFLNPMFTSALLMLYLKINIIIMEKVFICENSAFMTLPQTPFLQGRAVDIIHTETHEARRFAAFAIIIS